MPKHVPILMQIYCLMPAVSINNAVKNARDISLTQLLPPATITVANQPPLPARLVCDPDDRDMFLKLANRPTFTKASGVRI